MTADEGRGAKRSHLGRGLAALFGDEAAAGEPGASPDKAAESKSTALGPGLTLPIERLAPGSLQPRQRFDESELESLAESIKSSGLLQPILVRPRPGHPEEYEIVAGERRWRAAQIARLHEVPVIIRELADAKALEIALIENVQREDLSPIEEARAYQRLIAEFGHSQGELAAQLGKSRSHVANTLRLLSLPEAIQDLVQDGSLSAGHGRALIGADDAEKLAQRCLKEALSVRALEAMVKRARDAAKPPVPGAAPARPKKGASDKDADTLALERDLENMLGLKVSIDYGPKGGKLSIHYKTLEQLDDVLRRLNQVPYREFD